MSLANLLNVFDTQPELDVFSFSNQDQHRQIVDQLQLQKGLAVTLYPLDPVPTSDLASWARSHQQAHFDFTQALGIAAVDLTDVNFDDKAQLAAWLRLHFDEHRQAADILGII